MRGLYELRAIQGAIRPEHRVIEGQPHHGQDAVLHVHMYPHQQLQHLRFLPGKDQHRAGVLGHPEAVAHGGRHLFGRVDDPVLRRNLRQSVREEDRELIPDGAGLLGGRGVPRLVCGRE